MITENDVSYNTIYIFKKNVDKDDGKILSFKEFATEKILFLTKIRDIWHDIWQIFDRYLTWYFSIFHVHASLNNYIQRNLIKLAWFKLKDLLIWIYKEWKV